MELREITEGNTTFAVPVQDESAEFPPGSAPVFYNTRMEFNRDMTILLISVLQPDGYLDAMAATGVRGLRVANETHIPVVINDFNRQAVEIISENSRRFNESITVSCDDANRLMCSARIDAVDLDPFGTPIPFLDAACRAAKRYLFVTATDTAPLCGAHLKAGIRRYFSTPKNTDLHAEVGLRMMMGAMARELVKYDRGMEPLLSFARSHYYRSHVKIISSVAAADATVAEMGFIQQCPHCLYRTEEKGSLLPRPLICPECGAVLTPIGPLWMGKLQGEGIIDAMLASLPQMVFGTARQMEKLMKVLNAEPDIGVFYDYHAITRALKLSPPNLDAYIAGLNEAGYYTTRTHFCVTGLKTTAPLSVLKEHLIRWNQNDSDSADLS